MRDVLRAVAPVTGLRFEHFDGQSFEKHAHRIWTLPYESAFGPQAIVVEAALRPVLKSPRQVPLSQLLDDPLAGDYSDAFCWAVDADEARAEKVRAAFTRETPAIRDFYDLDQLLAAGLDLTSEYFVDLVDRKLAESRARPLSDQPRSFGLTEAQRRQLDVQARTELPAVIRVSADPFDLEATFARFDALWGKGL